MSFKDKLPEIQKQIDDLSLALFGRKTSESIENNTCVMCYATNLTFPDELSEREFQISGMCYDCQSKTFGM